MRIIWTRHAGDRQREWERKLGVTREDVETVIRTPEQVVPGDRGAMIAQVRYKGGLLRVAFLETDEGPKALTLYWTSRVGRYWKEGESADPV